MFKKNISKILSTFLAVTMIFCSSPLSGFVGLKFPELKLSERKLFDFSIKAEAATYSGTCGVSVKWSLDTSTGVLDITGVGAMYDYTYSSKTPWYSNRSYVKTVNIADGVTNIGDYAFYEHKSLTSVTIPDSVTSIGYEAFYNCSRLISITIPASITSIGSTAFIWCTSLTSIVIPDSVTNIGDWAFYGCSDLSSVIIGNGVTNIEGSTFYNCTALTSVTIGDGVTSIDNAAFSGCTNLTSVTVGKAVASIGFSAFGNCKRLTSVYYNGTEEEWNKIEIGEENKCLLNATIHFNGSNHEHSYTSSITKELTCTESGVKTFKCSCGYSYTETIEASGHIAGEEITENNISPTCLTGGSYDVVVYCTVCNEEISKRTVVILATGHNYNSVVTEPTATEQGYTTYTCSVCGYSYKDNFISTIGKVNDVSVNDFSLQYKSVSVINPDIKVDNGVYCIVAFISSNTSVATVDQNGNVTATGTGEAEITVTVTDEYGNVVKDTCKVTVSYSWWQWLIIIFLFGWIWY